MYVASLCKQVTALVPSFWALPSAAHSPHSAPLLHRQFAQLHHQNHCARLKDQEFGPSPVRGPLITSLWVRLPLTSDVCFFLFPEGFNR